MSNKQRNILIIIGILFITIPLIIWGIVSLNNRSNDTVIVDRDTAEVLNKEENNFQTGGSGVTTGEATLFGIEPFIKTLYDKNTSTAFVGSVKQALWNFGEHRLNNTFETITLRPQGLVFTGSKITGTIRLGQTDTILPITITPSKNHKQAVVTINEGGGQYKGTFVYVGGINNSTNLLFTISQKDDRSSDLEIKAFTGYREVALKYIANLGYNVPDFVINFNNYENPFDEK